MNLLCFIPFAIVGLDMILYLVGCWWSFVCKKEIKKTQSPFRKFNVWYVKKTDPTHGSPLRDFGDMYWLGFAGLFGVGGGVLIHATVGILSAFGIQIIYAGAVVGVFLAITFGARIIVSMFNGIKTLAKVAHTHLDSSMENIDVDIDILTSEERKYWEKIKAKASN